MGFSTGRGFSLLRGILFGSACGVLGSACGNGDDLDPYAGSDLPGQPVVVSPLAPAPASTGDGNDNGNDNGNDDGTGEAVEPTGSGTDEPGGANDPVAGGDGTDVRDPNACATPKDVSGRPTTIAEAMILMNSLPRPTTLACFLQALERPLSIYATSSSQSLQPSPGARSPRTFIINKPLVMSIVFDGAADIALELGFRTTENRSVKTEIHFPLTKDVTYANLFNEVMQGDNATRCSACHTAETSTLTPTLPMGVFESDILRPYDNLEVGVDALRGERASCDAAAEPERCALLSAFFDFGDVVTAPGGFIFAPGQ
jgi:hypothetical protein